MKKFQRNKVIPDIPGKDDKNEPHQKKSANKKFKKPKKEFIDRKKIKEILREKRARLVVKNLPFKATEEKIREYFGQYGNISSINILKKPDGKLIGCAFIQYTMVQFARKAKHYTDNEVFMGRTLNVDFAKAKDKYIKEKQRATCKNEVKNEDSTNSETEIVVIED